MSENFAPAVTWLAEQGALLRGLAHALSNRVGTLVAATGLLVPGGGASPTIVGVLRDETDRLEELLGLMRLLAGPADAAGEAAEPIHLPDLVTPAVELHSHHPALRAVPVTVEPDPLAPPVRARHAGLTRALLVLLSAAKQGAADGVRIAWRGDGDEVALTLDGVMGTEAPAAAARGLVGAPVEASVAGYLVRLPRV
jgi:nitrogen-specific signal transduction histidine kinase